MINLYKMQGFKNMVKSNPNMSEYHGIIQQDFIRDGDEDNMISAQITGRSVNMMEFSRMIEKLRYAHIEKKAEKEKFREKFMALSCKKLKKFDLSKLEANLKNFERKNDSN